MTSLESRVDEGAAGEHSHLLERIWLPLAHNPVTTETSLERRLQRYHHGLQYGAGGESATPEGERRPVPMLPIEAPV